MTYLNFINRALDLCRPDIVFFHKDHTRPLDKVIAWKVIHRCGIDWNHPFYLPQGLELGLVDVYGNHSPRIPVQAGMAYTLPERQGPKPCWKYEPATNPTSIEVRNHTRATSVGCHLTRDGRGVVPIRWLPPGGRTSFRVNLSLWVGAVRKAREGEALGPFELEMSSTRLDLGGVVRGEVWMTGGGMGTSAAPFRFHLHHLS